MQVQLEVCRSKYMIIDCKYFENTPDKHKNNYNNEWSALQEFYETSEIVNDCLETNP